VSCLASVQSVLPSLGLTKQKVRKLDAICLAREESKNGIQQIAYHARPFILCGIPLRRPPAHQLTHTRCNGKFTLDIVGHPRYGLPFGQDRLIPVWVATLAVLQKSRVVRFANPSQMLDYFDLPKNGYHYHRIVHGFQRVFGATIFFGTEELRQKAAVLEAARFHFFDRMHIWYNREGHTDSSDDDPDNTIVLSEAFQHEIDQHKIPIERRVVAALANAPGILDLYVWLVWRSWSLDAGRQARVPLFGITGLVQQLGSKGYSRERDFCQKLAKWLREVKTWWPECPAATSPDSRFLVISSAKRSPAIAARLGE
jgi:hypothetical protein